ncbi:MAG: lysophospholipid acyltransferase family protein [Bacteroidota bacterium]
MRKLSFFLFFSLVRLLSLLPFTVILYGLSSILYPIIYYIVPYRKKIVFHNLRNSFPGKSDKEIKEIASAFYKHLCDSFIESTVFGFKPKKELIKRFTVKNPELCEELYKKKKSISLMMAHYGNWEWAAIIPEHIPHVTLPIYKPLKNKYFDRYVRKNRERFGARTVPMEKILKTLIQYEKKNVPTMTFFLADQRPLMAKIQYWTTFLNQDTPVVMGPEKIARHFNHAVLFLKIKKVKRGYYEAEFVKIAEEARSLEKYEIIEQYHSYLEKSIKEEPAYWLWTHKRWKHNLKDYYKLRGKPSQEKASS